MTHLRWVPPRSGARYGVPPSTPGPSYAGCPALRAPPCIWTFLTSLGEEGFFSSLPGERILSCLLLRGLLRTAGLLGRPLRGGIVDLIIERGKEAVFLLQLGQPFLLDRPLPGLLRQA